MHQNPATIFRALCWTAAAAAWLLAGRPAFGDDPQYKNLRFRVVRVVVELAGEAKETLHVMELRGRVLSELNADVGLAPPNAPGDCPEVHVFVEVCSWPKSPCCLVGVSTSVREKVTIERLHPQSGKRRTTLVAPVWETRCVDIVPCADLQAVVCQLVGEQAKQLVADYRKALREFGPEE